MRRRGEKRYERNFFSVVTKAVHAWVGPTLRKDEAGVLSCSSSSSGWRRIAAACSRGGGGSCNLCSLALS